MESLNIDVNIIADYICWKFLSEKRNISVSLLHKLLYLSQAWYLANYSKAIFEAEFEAWTHGPVNVEIRKRYEGKISATIPIDKRYLNQDELKNIPEDVCLHLDKVIEDYKELSFLKLEEIIQENDTAWKDARQTSSSTKKTNNIISKESMMNFYSSLNPEG